MTFEPEAQDSQSKALKTRIIAWFPLITWVKQLAFVVGAQGLMTLAKNA